MTLFSGIMNKMTKIDYRVHVKDLKYTLKRH